MSDDQPDLRPKIELQAMARIGRELRAMYANLSEQPLTPAMVLALHSIEDAEHGILRLEEAADALRRADEPSQGPLTWAARRVASVLARLLSSGRKALAQAKPPRRPGGASGFVLPNMPAKARRGGFVLPKSRRAVGSASGAS
jgi:hypothetical protein